MNIRKQHLVVINNSDGTTEKYPLKQWLRLHPESLPKGMTTDNTSHELRSKLKQQGWSLQENENEVLVIMPGAVEELYENAEVVEEVVSEIKFGLERDMQSALRANIKQLEAGLKIIDGGKERVTEAGRIDITAEDAEGNIVIIELKAGTATSDVVAQILAYMGVVSEIDKKPVRGILIAGEYHKQVIFAAKAIQNLNLMKYSFQFTFEPVKKHM